MKWRDDISGQLMLTGAFILAVLLVSIALILNNVVYFNNVSYMGFMEYSGNTDTSTKDLVAQEAINAYDEARNDINAFNRTMQDVANSLNNVTLQKGIKVIISPPDFYKTPYESSLTYLSTKFNLTIFTKDSIKTYTITTTHYPPPSPPPSVQPLDCSVSMVASKTQLNVIGVTDIALMDRAVITVRVLDNKSQPLGGVPVNLNAMLGTFYDQDYNLAYPETDSSGYAVVYYIPTQKGVDILNASVGLNPSLSAKNRSSNVTITNYGICTHVVNIGTPANVNYGFDSGHGNQKNYWVSFTVLITVPVPPTDYNFTDFNVEGIFNNAWSDNAQFRSTSDMGGFTEPHITGPLIYQRNMLVKLGWKDEKKDFVANVTVNVNAFCNLSYAPYSTTSTFTIEEPSIT